MNVELRLDLVSLETCPLLEESPNTQDKTTTVVQEVLAESKPEQKLAEHEKVYTFPLCENEEWTKVEISIWWPVVGFYNTFIYQLIRDKLTTEDGRTTLAAFDLRSVTSVSQLEHFAVKMMKSEMTAHYERKKEVHEKVITLLKTVAQYGIWGARDEIYKFAQNP